MPPNLHNIIGPSVRPSVRSFVCLSVCPFVHPFGIFYFFLAMPFKLYIYLGAFVTYCDPILVQFTYIQYCRTCLTRPLNYGYFSNRGVRLLQRKGDAERSKLSVSLLYCIKLSSSSKESRASV